MSWSAAEDARHYGKSRGGDTKHSGDGHNAIIGLFLPQTSETQVRTGHLSLGEEGWRFFKDLPSRRILDLSPQPASSRSEVVESSVGGAVNLSAGAGPTTTEGVYAYPQTGC